MRQLYRLLFLALARPACAVFGALGDGSICRLRRFLPLSVQQLLQHK